jgi:carboxyl-terminal processing protease
MKKYSFLIGLAAGILAVCLALVGYNEFDRRVRWEGQTPPDAKVQEIFGMLDRYSIIPFERDELMNSMYRGLLDGVDDPYTQYLDAVALEAFRMRTEGVFAGIGVLSQMDEENRVLTVREVFENSPAFAAGLLPGDRIVAVDGENMIGRQQEEITELIRGPVDTPVMLTIQRPDEGREFVVSIFRALVEVPTVSHEMIEGMGLIRITSFDRVTYSQFTAALEDLTEQGMEGLIIDVRNNPGGLMSEVVKITNELVPEGVITYTEHADGRREYHRATGEALGLPLVVLVNERSASASEILGAAVQDTGAGVLVGTQTFGKGIVQNLMYLSDGNAIKMTIAKYFTPNGVSIHGVGVTPDIVVEMDEGLSRRIGTLPHEEDEQLQTALDTIYSLIHR